MITGRIRLRCPDDKSSAIWGLYVRDAVLDINTHCVRIHGYTPAEILRGYNPRRTRVEIAGGDVQSWLKANLSPEDVLFPSAHEVTLFIDRRDENGNNASERLARYQHAKETAVKELGGSYKRPKAGDLVLLRALARDKQLGRKLDPRWTQPRIVERLSQNCMSAYIRGLHEGPDKAKRYHIDDLRVYFSRSNALNEIESMSANTAITYARDAFGSRTGVFTPGQRAFDFSDLGQ